MGFRYDPPRPTSFSFTQADVDEMRKFMQEIALICSRIHAQDHTPVGVMAIGLANICADLLNRNYPENFRRQIIKEINRQIFENEPADETPTLVRLH